MQKSTHRTSCLAPTSDLTKLTLAPLLLPSSFIECAAVANFLAIQLCCLFATSRSYSSKSKEFYMFSYQRAPVGHVYLCHYNRAYFSTIAPTRGAPDLRNKFSDLEGWLVGDSLLFMPRLASTIDIRCFVLLVSLTLVNNFWYRCSLSFRGLLSNFSKKSKASRKSFFAGWDLSLSQNQVLCYLIYIEESVSDNYWK